MPLPAPLPATAQSAPMSSDADPIVLPSVLLDAVTVNRGDLFTFPAGLFGFEHCYSYALVPSGREGLWWLQSAERADVVFLVADPFRYYDNYEVNVPPADLALLAVDEQAPPMVLVIVTLPRTEADEPTANLRAPVLLATGRRVGRQVVLPDDDYAVRTPIALQ